ncbi:FkbM family methyltransferase [Litchfieldia salsa]|uniref:Methyltransferase, FkbM family n=1 Tax=Litchfieldia salsa TaxID=930152 RepID=A0A1H0T818_9BACI|nr:FkbM family methyltransferase [Litchfieldia salsa]SDP50159.1 methyltransferase, FkbM family [Litchfieldia salsa]
MSPFARPIISSPVISKLWLKYPRTWKYILNIGLLMKYKTIKLEELPTYIRLRSSFNLHIDPNENRGRALLISNGITQKHVVKFWEESVKAFSPTTVLDIGVNYGECLFSVEYPSKAKIYGIEANKQLLSFINKSKSTHPNQKQIKIINAFASNKEQKTQAFYVDKNWSGTSSGKEIYSGMVEKHLVKTITVDSLLKEEKLFKERILFKIDVEGYEPFVLEGMKSVIKKSAEVLGIIEFDSTYIKRSGTNIDLFLKKLSVNFKIYMFDNFGELHLIADPTMTSLQDMFKSREIHTDLILVKSESIAYFLS